MVLYVCVCVRAALCIVRQNRRAPSKCASTCLLALASLQDTWLNAQLHPSSIPEASPTAGNLAGVGAPGLIRDLAGCTCRRGADEGVVREMYVGIQGCMYVCMYVCMCVCMCACVYVCVHVCMYVCMCAHTLASSELVDPRKQAAGYMPLHQT